MDNSTLADLSAASTLSGSELLYGTQSGGDVKITSAQIVTLAIGAGTVSVASGKTLTASNSITFAGTDSTTMTFPSTSQTIVGLTATQTLTNKTIAFSSNTLTGVAPLASPTFSGTVTFADSSTITSSGISSTTINSSSIGATTASTGKFTTAQVNSAGSSSAPSLAIGNSTTGLYSVSTTGLGFSVNGTLVADYGITNSSGVSFPVTVFSNIFRSNSGNLTLESNTSSQTATLQTISSSGSGSVGLLSIVGGANTGTSSGNAGSVDITAGSATGTGSTGNGGSIILTPGTSVGGTPGSVAAGTPSISTSATGGFLYIPAGAGTPTGTPSGISGYVPIYLDTTNSQLWLYMGGSWKQPKTPAAAATVTWQ